jgi:excisionase family DNA binding protein
MSSDPLMTLAELAEYLRVPKETIYRWRKRGRGPGGFRMGRHVRFRRSEVEAWLETTRDAEPFATRSGPLFRR